VICWYCYEHGYPFEKYRKLRERFEGIMPETPGRQSAGAARAEQTVLMRRTLQGIHDENSLLAYLRSLKTDDNRVLPLQRQYNNSITLRVVYLFNEHRAKANKEASKKGQ
jgi:hypothetical protein